MLSQAESIAMSPFGFWGLKKIINYFNYFNQNIQGHLSAKVNKLGIIVAKANLKQSSAPSFLLTLSKNDNTELFKINESRKETDNSWLVKVEDIKDADISAKNPNAEQEEELGQVLQGVLVGPLHTVEHLAADNNYMT